MLPTYQMVSALKSAIKSLWNATCTITVTAPSVDEETGETRMKTVILHENEPCKIDTESTSAVSPDGNGAHNVVQSITLFIDSDITLPPGCRITVNQNFAAYCRPEKIKHMEMYTSAELEQCTTSELEGLYVTEQDEISVTRSDSYKLSGAPAVYNSHQEVPLEIAEDIA